MATYTCVNYFLHCI